MSDAAPPPVTVRPLRRATVMVADLDRALRLYRDAFGLRVWKHASVAGDNENFFRLLGLAPGAARFAILQAEGSEIGMVGLFEVRHPRPPALQRSGPPAINLGEVALVFEVSGVAELHRRIVALGLTVIFPPCRFDVPGGGLSMEMTLRDFDGALVNLVEPVIRARPQGAA